ncbi:MAG: hypothetical protein OXO49_00460 [Gammaproteobacteria bacterium]|nr:hypothetical protein [Gammaproteobacteria bacterium]MDE0251454.1 hypothetical protein [Gammaproteobacteria bacterium]MDE0401863.1 hypothetical protein [Gammaproteobacteria bacterium]
MEYREELPPNCPPPNAKDIEGPVVMYRMIASNTPTENDFDSLAKLNPTFHVKRPSDECFGRGVSVFSNPKTAKQRTERTKKDYRLCKIQLVRGAGSYIKSFGPHHYTWWPAKEFDILACCEVKLSD